jgi:xyloglucan fucosyltransferase
MQPLSRCTFVLFSVLFILLAVNNLQSRRIYISQPSVSLNREERRAPPRIVPPPHYNVTSTPPRCDAEQPYLDPVSTMHPATALFLKRYRHALRTGTPSKYLYFVPTQGVGNRMLGLVSVFVLALLTDRRLLIDWHGLNDLFDQPFEDIYNWQYGQSGLSIPTNQPTITIDHTQNGKPGWKTIGCGLLDEDSQWLVVSSNQYFLPILFSNPTLRSRLDAIFPVKSDAFSCILRYLFKPSKALQKAIDNFYNSSFTTHVIGIHSRIQTNKHEDYLDQMCINCLKRTQQITNCTRIYLASMHPEAFTAIRHAGYNVINPQGGAAGPEIHNFNNDWGALLDIYLLSRSHTFIASAHSTFGYVVSGLQGRNPIMLPVSNQLGNYTSDNRACWPSPSYEACAHMMSPFYYPLVLQGLCNPGISVSSERMSEGYKYC